MRFLTAVCNNDKIHQRNREKKTPFGNFVYSYFHKIENVLWIIISLHTAMKHFWHGAGINSGCNLQNTKINK
jgi:hypothetical protein